MIPNYTRGANYFGRLGRYLATGSVSDDTKSTERVAWMAYREIDPDMHWRVADEVMAATARTAVKQSCAEPTLHFMWSANPDDRYITRNEWEEIADKTLDRMGLVGHQAKIVEHNDTSYEDKPRQHIHIMANAVREDGLSWRIQSKKNPKNWGSGDYKWKSKLDELAREFERDYGLIELDTPLKAYREGREWEQARSKNRAEQEIDSRTGRTPDFPMTKVQIKEIAPHAKSIISSSKSWDEIQKSLYSEIGFSLKAKGPGLILRKEDGSYAKLSSLGKAKLSDQDKAQRLTKEHIGQAVGESWEDYWQRSEHKLDATKSKLMAGTYLSSSQFTDASQTSDEPSDRFPEISTPCTKPFAPIKNKEDEQYIDNEIAPDKFIQQEHEHPNYHEQNIDTELSMEQLPFQEFEADDIENWKTKLRDRVALARNWEHINSLARDHGLRLAEGWALHDGTNYLRLSSIDGVSLKRRQALLRETYSEYVLRNSKSRDNNEQKHDEDRKFKRIDRSFDISDDRER